MRADNTVSINPSFIDDCCSAFFCAICWSPAAVASLPFHVLADILSCLTSPFNGWSSAFACTQHQFSFNRTLNLRAQTDQFYTMQTFHTIENECCQNPCGTMAAPCVVAFFSLSGTVNTIKDKVAGKYNLAETSTLSAGMR